MKFEVGLDFLKIPQEHFHPLLVHFPIALWSCAFIFFILSFSGKLRKLEFPACVMGLAGSVFGFLAMKAGEKSVEILGDQICQLQLLESHESNAETAFIFYTGSFVLLAVIMMTRTYVLKRSLPILLNIIPAFGMLLGGAYLVKAGHQGYQLVFMHGVGVSKDPPQCQAN